MFERLRNGWRLAAQVRKKVFSDKSLLYYAVLSAIVVIVEAAVIFATLILPASFPLPSTSGPSGSISTYQTLVLIVALFIFYLVSSFTSAYIMMALYIAFKSYSGGVKIGMGEAFSRASSYIGVLLEWALFYSTVIMMIRMIEARFRGFSGYLFSFLASAALSVGLIFAMPVIYEKKVGPLEAMKVSAKTFISHFGSSFGGIAYTDLYGLGIMAIGVLVFLAMILLSSFVPTVSLPAIIIGVVGLLLFIILGAVIAVTTSSIFKLLLYDYASGKGLPDWLDESMVRKALVPKRGRGGNSNFGGSAVTDDYVTGSNENPYSEKF